MISMDFPPKCRGIGYRVYDMSKKLVKREHNVCVITRNTGPNYSFEIIEGIKVYRMPFFRVYPFHLFVHGLFVNRLLARLNCIDVIHLHTPIVPIIKTHKPMITTVAAPTMTGIKKREMNDWLSIGLKLFSPIFIRIDKKNLSNSKLVYSISKNTQNELDHYYNQKSEIVPDGIDFEIFSNSNREKYDNRKTILFVGAFDGIKGIPTLINGLNLVKEHFPDVLLLMIGDGPLMSYIIKLIETLKLQSNVRIIGYVPRDELANYYNLADVFVLPSLHEGLPYVIREAMATGVPVIATDVPGNNDLITDGVNGVLLPPNNPHLLAQSILNIFSNQTYVEKVVTNGYDYVKSKFDLDKIVDKYEIIYEKAIELYSS